MKELNPVFIETPRLILTGYSFKDITNIFENFSKSEIKQLLGHRTEEDYQKEEYKHKNGYASYNRNFILFLITEKATNTYIGRCGLHNWNEENKRAEIGYYICDDIFKRKRFMTEAVGPIIDYGFNVMKLHRIEALIGGSNIPSLSIIENFHFTKEGLLREHVFIGDRYEDSIVYSLLYNEYVRNQGERRSS